jgi:hypothetical protein
MAWHVRFCSESDQIGASQRTAALRQKPTFALQQIFIQLLVGDWPTASELWHRSE